MSTVTLIDECPINVETVFKSTPAAIMWLPNVCAYADIGISGIMPNGTAEG